VYYIFEESSTQGLEDCYIFPEWHFIQYILPCFVTLIGQHATNPKTKASELHAYTRFVHNLIKSFEFCPTIKYVEGEPGTIMETRTSDLPDMLWVNLAKNLKKQLQEVESELAFQMYGTHNRMKRADMEEIMLGQVFFRLIKGTLRTSSLERGESTIFRCWGETLLLCVPRMTEALTKELMLPTNPFPVNNLLCAHSILKYLSNFADICGKTIELDYIHEILDLADQKMKTMMGKQPNALRSNMRKKHYLMMQKASVQQLLGSAMFLLVFKWNENMTSFLMDIYSYRLELFDDAVNHYAYQEWSKLRSLLAPLLSDKDGNDLSVMTLDFAKKCMLFVFDLVTGLKESKTKNDSKPKFSRILPVVPIKLCRGCGQFEECEIKLSMCRVCVDNRDYSDIHWFCGKECEENVLAEGHLEEHDHFLMLKLGLVDY
jgi:hypothetical protein